MIPHAGITHASGWIIIKKIQVAITQEVSTIRNNLIFANNVFGGAADFHQKSKRSDYSRGNP